MQKNVLVLADGSEISAGTAGKNAIRSLAFTEAVSDADDLAPGAACAGKLELILWVEPGDTLRVTSGTVMTYCLEDKDGSREQVGVFTAVKPTRASRNTYKVYAYDAVSRLDRNLSGWLRANQSSFPMGLYAFAQAVCTQCGVTLANTSLPNGDYQIQAFYADNLTGRQLLQWVGQACGRFLRARADGKLEYAWYTDRRAEAGIRPYSSADVDILAATSDGELLVGSDGLYLLLQDEFGVAYPYAIDGLTYEDYETEPLDKVQIRQSDDDVGVIYPADETGTNAYVVQGNLLLTTGTAAALQPIAKALYDLLRPVTYTPAKIKLLASGVIRPGDIVRVQDANGKEFTTYIMTRTASGGADTLESTGNPSRDSVSAVNQQTYKNLQGRMLEISASVDGLNVKASELSGDYAQLSLTVDGLETRVEDTEGNYSTLSQTVSSLTSTVNGKINGAQAQTLIDQSLQGITLSASNGSTTSTLTLKSGETTLASAEITFSGMVTFSALDGRGYAVKASLADANYTTINGSNITTGQIHNAASTTVYDLSASPYIRMGPSGGTRIEITADGLRTYSNNYLTGVMTHKYGQSAYCCNSVCSCFGWTSSAAGPGTGQTNYRPWYGNSDDGTFRGLIYDAVNHSIDIGRDVNLGLQGGSKNKLIVSSFGIIGIEAMESPEPTFWDMGSGVCDADGLCVVVLDPRYREAIDPHYRPRWIVTPTDAQGPLWVEKTDGGAVVHGASGQPFDWACNAAQQNCAGRYAPEVRGGSRALEVAVMDATVDTDTELETDLLAALSAAEAEAEDSVHTLLEVPA